MIYHCQWNSVTDYLKFTTEGTQKVHFMVILFLRELLKTRLIWLSVSNVIPQCRVSKLWGTILLQICCCYLTCFIQRKHKVALHHTRIDNFLMDHHGMVLLPIAAGCIGGKSPGCFTRPGVERVTLRMYGISSRGFRPALSVPLAALVLPYLREIPPN